MAGGPQATGCRVGRWWSCDAPVTGTRSAVRWWRTRPSRWVSGVMMARRAGRCVMLVTMTAVARQRLNARAILAWGFASSVFVCYRMRAAGRP